jgi:hypothetical protein
MLRNQTFVNRTDKPPDFDVIQTQIRHEGYKSQDTIALLTPTTSLYKRPVRGGRDITEIPTCHTDRLPQVATPQPWSLLPLVSIQCTLCNPASQLGNYQLSSIDLLNEHAAKTSHSCQFGSVVNTVGALRACLRSWFASPDLPARCLHRIYCVGDMESNHLPKLF